MPEPPKIEKANGLLALVKGLKGQSSLVVVAAALTYMGQYYFVTRAEGARMAASIARTAEGLDRANALLDRLAEQANVAALERTKLAEGLAVAAAQNRISEEARAKWIPVIVTLQENQRILVRAVDRIQDRIDSKPHPKPDGS